MSQVYSVWLKKFTITVVAIIGLIGFLQPGLAQASPGSSDSASSSSENPAPLPRKAGANRNNNPQPILADGQAVVPGNLPKSSATVQGPNQVGFGRVAILFTRAETLAIAQGKYAPPQIYIDQLKRLGPAGVTLAVALTASIKAFKYIAQQYYNKGLCTAYTVSVRPWDNQGFMSRKC